MLYTKVSVFSIQQQYIILLQLHTTSCYTVTFIRSFCRFCLITRATLDFIIDSGMKKGGIKKKKKKARIFYILLQCDASRFVPERDYYSDRRSKVFGQTMVRTLWMILTVTLCVIKSAIVIRIYPELDCFQNHCLVSNYEDLKSQ